MLDLGIVIVSYNTRDLLRTCLRSVYASQGYFTFEVCVVDNASRDGSAEMVAAEFPQVRLIANRENVGYPAANNQALRAFGFTNQPTNQLTNQPTNQLTNPPTILFTGRLRYYKGIDTLITALGNLPGVHLNIVGEGPMREVWATQAAEMGLSERVHFLGEVDDAELPDVYRQADLFILPCNARAEAFGSVLLEAMASGLACITTEVGSGTSWVVQDGVTGLVVPPRDPQALAQAIRSLLDDPERRAAMGRAGRARVEAEFTLAQMIARVQAVYEEVLTM